MKQNKKETKMKNILLCACENGRALVYGKVEHEPVPGKPVELHDARMVIYYPSGGTFGLASDGPPEKSRVTHAVAKVVETRWQEWLAVSDKAAAKFDALD
jgi:hypothetical protein